MLSPVVSAEAVEAEGTIFVGGGVPFGNGMEVFRLDSERDRWTRVANLPVSRTNYALAAYGDSLYAIGGSVFVIGEGQVPQPSVFVYSIERDRWVDGIAMPEGRAHHATTVVGERIVVLGGIREFGRSTKLAVYDLTTGQWSEGAALTRDGASLRD
jgi:N-acetylneuraminic acid mutarotase